MHIWTLFNLFYENVHSSVHDKVQEANPIRFKLQISDADQ